MDDDRARRARSWHEAVATFVESRQLAPSTELRYLQTLRRFAPFVQADEPGAGAWRADIGAYALDLRERHLQPATAREDVRLVRAVLTWLDEASEGSLRTEREILGVALHRLDAVVRPGRDPDAWQPTVAPPIVEAWRAAIAGDDVVMPGDPRAVVDLELGRMNQLAEHLGAAAAVLPSVETGGELGAEPDAGEAASGAASASDEAQPTAVEPRASGGGGGQRAEPHGGGRDPGRRYLTGSATSAAAPGDDVVVRARVALEPGDGASAPIGLGEVPAGGLDIELIIETGAGLTIVGPASQTVHVPPNGGSAPAEFHATAREPGRWAILVSAFRSGTYVGALRLETAVDAALDVLGAAPSTGTGPLSDRPDDPAELSLRVRFRQGAAGGNFIYQLVGLGPTREEVTSEYLVANIDDPLRDVVKRLDEDANDTTESSRSYRERRLRGLGADLWRDLVPDELKEQFWAVESRIRRLTILGTNDPLPWELLRPSRPGTDPFFLAERFEMTRWVTGTPPASRRLPHAGVRYVVPPGGPSAARSEVASLRKLDPSMGAGQILRTLEEVASTIDGHAFDLLHFASHNQYGGAVTGVPFGRQVFDPTMLGEAVNGVTLRERAPLVFMNACRTAGTDPSFFSMSGWATKFLGAGAGAFVGSLWAVRDRAARTFALTFYKELLQGQQVGPATRTARLAAKSDGDPTWLAYAVYADPAATFRGRTDP